MMRLTCLVFAFGAVLPASAQLQEAESDWNRGFHSILFPVTFETTVTASGSSLLDSDWAFQFNGFDAPSILETSLTLREEIPLDTSGAVSAARHLTGPALESLLVAGGFRRIDFTRELAGTIGGLTATTFSHEIGEGDQLSSVFTTVSVFNLLEQ